MRAAGSGATSEYKVHYLGWNKKWDEWLEGKKIIKDTVANRQAHGLEKAKPAAGAGGDVKRGSGKFKGGADGGRSSDPAAAHKSKKARAAGEGGVGAKKGKGGKAGDVGPPPAAPPPEDLRLHVNLSTALKRELITGWERITREDKLVSLPRAITVSHVLARYEADARARARNPEQAELAAEVCAGLRAYFDRALRAVLLYKQERAQAERVLDAGGANLAPSEVYGAEHLLRLFVKLPDLLPVGDMDTDAAKALQLRLTEFLRWLQRNTGTLFGAEYVDRGADGTPVLPVGEKKAGTDPKGGGGEGDAGAGGVDKGKGGSGDLGGESTNKREDTKKEEEVAAPEVVNK